MGIFPPQGLKSNVLKPSYLVRFFILWSNCKNPPPGFEPRSHGKTVCIYHLEDERLSCRKNLKKQHLTKTQRVSLNWKLYSYFEKKKLSVLCCVLSVQFLQHGVQARSSGCWSASVLQRSHSKVQSAPFLQNLIRKKNASEWTPFQLGGHCERCFKYPGFFLKSKSTKQGAIWTLF